MERRKKTFACNALNQLEIAIYCRLIGGKSNQNIDIISNEFRAKSMMILKLCNRGHGEHQLKFQIDSERESESEEKANAKQQQPKKKHTHTNTEREKELNKIVIALKRDSFSY